MFTIFTICISVDSLSCQIFKTQLRMKTLIYNTIQKTATFSLLILLFSCEDYLEKPPSVDRTLEVQFSNIQNAEEVLNAAYYLLPTGFSYLDFGAWSPHTMIYGANVSVLCDEAEALEIPRQYAMGYNDGTITSGTIYPFLEDKWNHNWSAIRSAYLFLENIDKVPNMTSPANIELITNRKGEAYAIIAIKYFEMFKRYGGMPWMNRVYKSTDQPDLKRLTVEATVDSIASIFDKAIQLLPLRYDSRDYGRITKIGALAAKARLLVYAASPQFNSNSTPMEFGRKDLLAAPYKIERWKKAMEACKVAINIAHENGYKLINTGNPGSDYKKAWRNMDATVNTEVLQPSRSRPQLRAQMFQRAKIFARTPYPSQYHTGIPASQPTHNLVEMYEMKDPNAVYDPLNPYNGLDPRFYETILTQGSSWAGLFTIDFSVNKNNINEVLGNNNSTGKMPGYCTGYALAKFAFPEVDVVQQEIQISWPYIRLADLYLLYAECSNEYYQNPTTDAYFYFNEVRKRAGMTEVSGLNYSQFKDKIIHERAIELAFEQQRYWDLRRWRRTDLLRNTNYGIRVLKDKSTNKISYEKFKATERKFPDSHYYFAFPLDDVLKSAPDLIQNPGW